MSSADTTPISPARFAAALRELSVPMLHLKVLEIRNAMAHLQYSNDQLAPFAGTDPDCADAIRENEAVLARMEERIALVRIDVEDRGVAWNEFASKEGTEAGVARAREEQQQQQQQQRQQQQQEEEATGVAQITGAASSPWTDGTFQTGTIRNGEMHLDAPPRRENNSGAGGGGSLSDEQLRAAMEERMRQMTTEEDEEGGLHL